MPNIKLDNLMMAYSILGNDANRFAKTLKSNIPNILAIYSYLPTAKCH